MTALIRTIGMILVLALSGCATVDKAPPQPAPRAQEVPPSMTGKLVETMDAAAYTYINLEDNGRRSWYAIPVTKVALGQVLTVRPAFEMVDFKSRELNRTFEKIYFSDGLALPKDSAAEDALRIAHGPVPDAEDRASATPADPPGAGAIKVDRASGAGAFTIAELYEKKNQLDKQGVEVRAQVVKVSKGVMGKNWLHLRDGSGDAARHDNDLVATTQDDAAIGEVVTIHGIVYKDKDFGAGYKYSMIMEEGSIKR
jgi:hypothetical protein